MLSDGPNRGKFQRSLSPQSATEILSYVTGRDLDGDTEYNVSRKGRKGTQSPPKNPERKDSTNVGSTHSAVKIGIPTFKQIS